jgi:transcriptional regulator with XRE-family HTH domain
MEGMVTITNAQPSADATRLAERLRKLREQAPIRLTQAELGQALGDVGNAVSPATISTWENAASGRTVPPSRVDRYAQLFCTPRSFEGGAHLLDVADLTDAERSRMEELREELLHLRRGAVAEQETPAPREAESMWHFPDGSRITLVCSRLSDDRRPPSADPADLDHVKFAGLADLDALIEIYGAVKAHNPTSRVVIMAAQDLTHRDVANHLVLIGGQTWESVAPWFSRISHIPIEANDPGMRGAIVVRDPENGKREFKYTLAEDELVEDVGFFIRGENPSAPRRTLTVCSGITSRGVLGVAKCFIDWEMQYRNSEYLSSRFPHGSTYCIIMRVPVVNKDPLTPDLSRDENRLFEWSDPPGKAGSSSPQSAQSR